jgi:hypothetical protein
LRVSGATDPGVQIIPSDPADPNNTNRVIQLPPLLTSIGPAQVWIGLKNSDDVGTKFDVLAEVFKVSGGVVTKVGYGQRNDIPGGSSGFNNAKLDLIDLTLPETVELGPGDALGIRLSVRLAAGSGHKSGTARLWFNDTAANSRFPVTLEGKVATYFLESGDQLATTAGLGPKETRDARVDRAIAGNSFVPFGSSGVEDIWKIVY